MIIKRLKLKLKIFGCCFILLIPIIGFSQTPINDENWQPALDSLFDEFDNGIDWNIYDPNYLYHYVDHNFGHGDKHLSTNFILLMMLAFLTDQTCEISCNLFKAALKVAGTRTYFWKKIRRLFDSFLFDSMNQIYEAIYYGIEKPNVVFNDT